MLVTNTSEAFLESLYLGFWLFKVIFKTYLHLPMLICMIKWSTWRYLDLTLLGIEVSEMQDLKTTS